MKLQYNIKYKKILIITHIKHRWSIIKSNHPKAVGSSPFYIHEYVFSSKFLRNCDASKHIRFLKRTQAVNSTNKYTCVYRMYYGMVQICWTNSPFLFPWNTKIPMYFFKQNEVAQFIWSGRAGLNPNINMEIEFWTCQSELWTHSDSGFSTPKLNSNPFQSLQKSQTSNLFFQDQVKPGHIYINLLLLIDMNSIWEMIFYLCNLGN